MAKKSSNVLLLGAAGAAGAFWLWSKSKKGATILPDGTVAPTPLSPTAPGVDTTSAAYLTAVANAAQQAAAQLPNGCQQTPYGVVCPSNFNNPTLNPPTPLVCPTGYKANSANTVCELLSPPPPPISPPPPPPVAEVWQEVCENGQLLRKRATDNKWTNTGQSCAGPAKCREVIYACKPEAFGPHIKTPIIAAPWLCAQGENTVEYAVEC